MEPRAKRGIFFSICCGIIIFLGYLLLLPIAGKSFEEVYFTKDSFFFKILYIMVGCFVAGWIYKSEDDDYDDQA
jgi:hypothetical protein